VAIGGRLALHAPLGDVVLTGTEDPARPAVLLSGGAGITPALAMLHHLAGSAGGNRPVAFIHAARDRAHHAFGAEVRALGRSRPGIDVTIFYETVDSGDRAGEHHDRIGRIDAESLRPLLPSAESDIYVSGPPGFIAAAGTALDRLGVSGARCHVDTFAPTPDFRIG
jgi:nitric oxide dioxygenase